MVTEVIYQILLVALIVAVIFLIFVLWKLYTVLIDLKTVSTLASKRSIEIDKYLGKILQSMENIGDTVKGFIYSLDFIKAIKEKFINKKEQNEQ